MSLAANIRKSVAAAMDGIGDVKEQVEYVENGAATYDPTTGTYTQAASTHVIRAMVNTFGRASLARQSANETRSEHSGELSVLISAKGLKFTPDTGGEIIRKSERYKVSEVIFGLAGSSYRLIVERKG